MVRRRLDVTANSWWMHLLWVVAAGAVGFGITAVFAAWLKLRRGWVVLAYASIAGAFLYAYFWWSQIDLVEALQLRWPLGLAGAVVVGLLMVRNVLSQPPSPRSEGTQLIFDLLWCGVVYGVLDGVFLSVMPLLASWRAFSELGWMGSWPGTAGAALVGLLASSYVTTTYHLGYPQFRGSGVGMPVLGNAIMSLSYILTRNPLSAVLSHAAMHVGAVMHGMEATIQLPPHY
jgi:hypothetical protein